MTAEAALVLPVIVATLALALAGLSLVIDHVRCVDAARVGARLAARGEPVARIVAATERSAPAGAEVTVRQGGSYVDVTVSVSRSPIGLGRITLSAVSSTPAEDPP